MGYTLTPEPSIVTEFMARGSLFHILRRVGNRPPDVRMQRVVAIAVARGMAYLHSRAPPILHLDLKSPNVLVDDRWRVKIAGGTAALTFSCVIAFKYDLGHLQISACRVCGSALTYRLAQPLGHLNGWLLKCYAVTTMPRLRTFTGTAAWKNEGSARYVEQTLLGWTHVCLYSCSWNVTYPLVETASPESIDMV